LQGQEFEERFLIADVEMKADFPSERWFWFEPTFHPGQSALLHKQPDNIYRIDLQLGWDADPEIEKRPQNVVPRIERVLGRSDFELDWVSVYTFQCRRLERFVHDHVIFVGDSAHVVSPFGARGGNGGIQDVDNLGWKLAAVLKGRAPSGLLGSYDDERRRGADENIGHSSRATNFMTPKSKIERLFRDSVLGLAGEHDFARRMVNSGRLSKPCSLAGFSLQSDAEGKGGIEPGAAMPDAPVTNGKGGWLLNHLGGGFAIMAVGAELPEETPAGVERVIITRDTGRLASADRMLLDTEGLATARYGAGMVYLVRPDQHIAARFRDATPAKIAAALARATGGAA
jgi:3-(3-hydroxy-phenyl)propionate hydroxylase